jgi:UDP-N-acetylglucosamine transferase subunit ALG13
VPVIRYLLEKGCRLSVAGNEWQRQYIENTFPGIHTIHLDGYNVWYSKNGSSFLPALMMQLPRLAHTIMQEHEWLKHAVDKFGFNGVITDNRYGLYHATVPNVILTHQVVPQTGWGKLPDSVLHTLHDKRLSCFKDCWIVDAEHGPNLAGSLSRPSVMPANATYIGLLSQYRRTTVSEEHLLVLLSGPEPQRGMLSDMLWEQLKNYNGKIVFVEGSNDVPERDVPANMEYHKRLNADKLTPLIAAASMVICRSGYSTLMDLLAMDKKAIIIPTPGQAEQEYLGKYLHEHDVFYCAHQKHLDIMASLNNTEHFPFNKPETKNVFEQFKMVVDEWVEKL